VRFRLLFTIVCLAGATFCFARNAAKPTASADIPDTVTADGKHYNIEFENEYVRVPRIHYGPHEKGNMHNHPHSVTTFLTDGELKMTFPDGKTRNGSVKAGQVVWEEAGPHQPENLSALTFEAVRVELKDPKPPAR